VSLLFCFSDLLLGLWLTATDCDWLCGLLQDVGNSGMYILKMLGSVTMTTMKKNPSWLGRPWLASSGGGTSLVSVLLLLLLLLTVAFAPLCCDPKGPFSDARVQMRWLLENKRILSWSSTKYFWSGSFTQLSFFSLFVKQQGLQLHMCPLLCLATSFVDHPRPLLFANWSSLPLFRLRLFFKEQCNEQEKKKRKKKESKQTKKKRKSSSPFWFLPFLLASIIGSA
jgi:hypothetical protein